MKSNALLEKKVKVKCHNCGYEWETKSGLVAVTCPNCGFKTKRNLAGVLNVKWIEKLDGKYFAEIISGEKTYILLYDTVENVGICSCLGFVFRKNCKHLEMFKKIISEGYEVQK
jgi:predicted nucleic-acid-binding Zn-ribbon protein